MALTSDEMEKTGLAVSDKQRYFRTYADYAKWHTDKFGYGPTIKTKS